MNGLPFTRRGFLKSTAAAGAALSLGGTRAFGQGASEINMIGWNSQPLMDLFARSEKEVGVKINYDVLPSKWTDVMQKITLWGQTGYSGIDILFADDLISGLWGMNGWAEDLSGTDAWTKNSSDVVDNITDLNNAIGGVYRIFYTMGIEPFCYNKALIPTPPKDWAEMVSVAQKFTDPANGKWGWRPLGGDGHAFNTVLLMLNQAGADLFSLEDPATLTALQYMYDWVHTAKITPPSTISEGMSIVEAQAAAGATPMWWDYDGALPNVYNAENTQVPLENLGVARWPMGPASDIGLAHGWGWLLSTFSAKKEASIEVLNWLATPDIQREIAVGVTAAPAYRSLFTDPVILEKLPQLTMGPGWDEMIRGAKFREPIVNSRQVTQLWSMFDKLGEYVLSGQKNPAESQAWAIGEYKIIRES